jgi:hypothetical protein
MCVKLKCLLLISYVVYFLSPQLLLTLNVLSGIISTPIVQRSKESNVPAWLTLPTVGCLCGGAILLFSPSSVLNNETGSDIFWIGVTYLVSACTFFLAAVLGWTISVFPVLNSRAKKQKQIVVYLFIGTMICTVFSVGKYNAQGTKNARVYVNAWLLNLILSIISNVSRFYSCHFCGKCNLFS